MADSPVLVTQRLKLRPPRPEDAESIFSRYASDRQLTRLLGWPRHTHIEDTQAFLSFSESEWARWPAGPMLIESRERGELLGSTGLAFETEHRASTGFLLTAEARGFGFASEALTAITALAEARGVQRLYALCHTNNSSSVRVLGRCGFRNEGILAKFIVFPNLDDSQPQDVYCFARVGTVGS
jgi:ribosomal-protein-alanine N-acetyltransferase